jgi:V8-like Glu-specific endopeptidase
LPLDPSVLKLDTPLQRLYIIGHPGGRDLEFSLQDNYLLAASERLVHYRTPSEGGSSGSPVFGPTDWKVVALHHAGRNDMPRLDGQGTYEANEGIALAALTKAILSG